METAITVDADILNKAMQIAAGQTQRQLVENALRLLLCKTGKLKRENIGGNYSGKAALTNCGQ